MYNLNSLPLPLLDSHIKKLVCSERQVTDQILKAITELDARRGYAELGYSSLFAYLTVGVGYSESSAQRRIAAARLMTKVSEPVKDTLRDKLKAGAINLSQLSKISSLVHTLEQNKFSEETNACVQNPINANTLVENLLPQIENKGLVKTEGVIADVVKDLCPSLNFEKPEKSKIRNEAGGKVTITLSLNKEQNEKLQKVLAKKSHAIPDGDINILFEKLLDKELKGYNVQTESASSDTTVTNAISTDAKIKNQGPNKSSKSRKYISIKVKRRVLAKAKHRCQYVSPITGERCPETKYLTLDHITPLALGGTDEEQNIQCLCFCHNLSEAKRMGIGRNRDTFKTVTN
jgi:5-methylcytosine-specific restriction endonuclease McrA